LLEKSIDKTTDAKKSINDVLSKFFQKVDENFLKGIPTNKDGHLAARIGQPALLVLHGDVR
jgi:hypothetical protein